MKRWHNEVAEVEVAAGGGMSRGGGGMSRPSPSRSPSMSRPSPSRSPSMSRPSPSRPSGRLRRAAQPLDHRQRVLQQVVLQQVDLQQVVLPLGDRRTNCHPLGDHQRGQPTVDRSSCQRGRTFCRRERWTSFQGPVNNFLDLNQPSTRPSTRPGGGAAGDFLQNRPATGTRPKTIHPTCRATTSRRRGGSTTTRTTATGTGTTTTGTTTAGCRTTTRAKTAGTKATGCRTTARTSTWKIPPGGSSARIPTPGSRPPGYRPPGYRPPRPGHLPAYGAGYWGRYPNYRYRWNNYNRNWWAYATAGAVTGWLISGINTQPVYYDYGTNLYYEGDNVYYDGQAIGTTEEYAQQAQTIATSVPRGRP